MSDVDDVGATVRITVAGVTSPRCDLAKRFTVARCYDPIIHSDRFRLSSAGFPLPLER